MSATVRICFGTASARSKLLPKMSWFEGLKHANLSKTSAKGYVLDADTIKLITEIRMDTFMTQEEDNSHRKLLR